RDGASAWSLLGRGSRVRRDAGRPGACLGYQRRWRSVKPGAGCYALPNGGPPERLLLVALPRGHVRGVPPPLLLPLLRRLGRLGADRDTRRAAALRPEAADGAAGLGGADGPRGRGARAPRAPRGGGAIGDAPRRGHGAAHARGMALLPARGLS